MLRRLTIYCLPLLLLLSSHAQKQGQKPASQQTESLTQSLRAHVQEGVRQFFAGRMAESIREFEAATELNSALKPQLWQLGIAYYYAGDYLKGRRQFELHQTVNPQDVENAIWHFLCVTKLDGIEAARKAFIPITDDSRVPMKELHALFAGKGKPEQVLEAAQAGTPSETEQKNRLCYAHLYLGLYEEALGHATESLAHVKRAAEEFKQPHYMGEVARVHVKLRSAPSPQTIP